MKLSKVSFYILLSFIFIASFSSCINLAGDVTLTEIKRLPSPDHKVDAVLVEANAGATTSTSTKVFIVKPSQKVSIDNLNLAVFNSDKCVAGDISWKENKQLIISYKSARIFHYTNFWEDSDSYDYKVDVLLNIIH